MRRSDTELNPRNGNALIVGVPCRSSGGVTAKEASLNGQQDNATADIAERYESAVNFRVLAAVGKGEQLDRPGLAEIERTYQSAEYDVFVDDDLGRHIRGGDAVRLLGIGEDNGARSICTNDGIDMAQQTWNEDFLINGLQQEYRSSSADLDMDQTKDEKLLIASGTGKPPDITPLPDLCQSLSLWQDQRHGCTAADKVAQGFDVVPGRRRGHAGQCAAATLVRDVCPRRVVGRLA